MTTTRAATSSCRGATRRAGCASRSGSRSTLIPMHGRLQPCAPRPQPIPTHPQPIPYSRSKSSSTRSASPSGPLATHSRSTRSSCSSASACVCARRAREPRSGCAGTQPSGRSCAASEFCCEYSSVYRVCAFTLFTHTHKKASLACVATTTTTKSTHPHAARGCLCTLGSRCKPGETRESASGSTDSGSASALRAAPPIPPNTRLTRHTAAGQAGALPLWHGCAVACGLCAARLACHCQLASPSGHGGVLRTRSALVGLQLTHTNHDLI